MAGIVARHALVDCSEMKFRTIAFAAAMFVAVFAGLSAPAKAVTFSVTGKDAETSTALIDFHYDGISRLTLGITNTVSASHDPRITSFAFNLPTAITGATLVSVSGTANDGMWKVQTSQDGIKTPGNLGKFDLAGITGPNFNGGSPNHGIGKGDTGLFVIDFIGDAEILSSLTDMSFLSLLSVGGKEAHEFAVRFQKLAGGSDVAIGGPGNLPNPIPLPASALFLLSGVAGMGLLSARRRRAAEAA